MDITEPLLEEYSDTSVSLIDELQAFAYQNNSETWIQIGMTGVCLVQFRPVDRPISEYPPMSSGPTLDIAIERAIKRGVSPHDPPAQMLIEVEKIQKERESLIPFKDISFEDKVRDRLAIPFWER